MAINWRSLLQGFAGIGVTIIVLLVCIAYFTVGLATRSNPTAHEDVSSEVRDTVHVYRNSFGIPHVVALSDTDLVYAQGYLHAQDRLWQMDVWRRTAQGRLAEIFGADLAPTDAFLRSLDLPKLVHKHFAALPPQTKTFLTSYANGVSSFIQANQEKLPFEFDALGYYPQPWKAEDCLLVMRMLALHQSPALFNDIVYTQIAAQRGLSAMVQYVPWKDKTIYSLDSSTASPPVYTPLTFPDTVSRLLQGEHALHGLIEANRSIGLPSTLHASNCWAVGRGSSGSILANDPHLAVGMPSRWYQVHLTSPRMNAVGLSIPGVPFIVSGRNDSLAWGITSAMVDDVDYAIERVDQSNSNYYYGTNGQRLKFKYRRDTIRIRNKPDSLIDLRYTINGCVISDGHPLHKHSSTLSLDVTPTARFMSSSCLIMRWTGQIASDEVGALYRINVSSTFNEVYQAGLTWGAPAFVVNLASHNGSVASFGMGYLPNRNGADMLLPHAAWEATQGWNGVLRLSDLRAIEKRTPGYVAAANNNLTPAGAPSQSILWEPTSRIERIQDQLKVYKVMTARDAQVLQQDVKSPFALSFTNTILPILKRARGRYNETEKTALRMLGAWDGSMTTVSPAASIHATLLQRMMWNTFEDELGTPLYNLWVYNGGIVTRRMKELLDNPTHILFDDARTKQRENLSWIAVRSFMEAVNELTQRYGSNNVDTWTWGSIHQVTFQHPMGTHRLLRPVVNVGPYDVGGSSTTVFNTEWSIQSPFTVRNTASSRIINDFADSVQYTVLPGGISGQALDGHYTDQMQLWLKGGYVRIPVSRRPDVTFRLFLRLVPTSVLLSAS